MATGAAGGDGLLRGMFEGCISGGDMGITRRPYHKNCGCALHESRGSCKHSSRNSVVSYPIRRSWSEGCLSLMMATGQSSPCSSPNPAAGGIKRVQTQLVLCKEENEEVPCVKRIKDKKVMHQQALELAKLLCERTAILPHSEAEPIYRHSIIKAAYHGIHEVVEVIIDMFPSAAFFSDPRTGSNIFLLAARERLEKVFSLIYKTKDKKHFFFDSRLSSWNNAMHMCAKIAPPHKLNLVSGAALQMQRELQWFEEMKKFVNPSRRRWKNKDDLTPTMLFTKEHKDLKEQGEKWMKETATSCTLAAALIATVVFSAAFTLPGGVSSTGIPNLLHEPSFILFTISDSVSLFTSTTSLLLFLSILTSRYAEGDFLYVLPKRLCMGLLALFTSIIFMMIAFTAAIYITVQHKSKLIIVPVALWASFPVATFVFLQFPLLIDVFYSTYGPGIFGKKSGRTPY